MSKPDAPDAPDPQEVAAAQTAQNFGTAMANQSMSMVNQNTPDGSLSYNQTGTTSWTDPNSGEVYQIPQYTATQTLSAENQAIKSANQRAQLNFGNLAANQSSRLDGMLSNPMSTDDAPSRFDFSSIEKPDVAGIQIGNAGRVSRMSNQDYGAQRDEVTNALMERNRGNQESDLSALESRLASQGIRVGSQAYTDAMGNHQQGVNDARYAAILAGGQEQSRLAGLDQARTTTNNAAQSQQFAQNATRAGFDRDGAQMELGNAITLGNAQNNNRSQALSEMYAARNQPINEISALMSGSQVSGPNFMNTPTTQMANTDTAGITMGAHQNALNAYNTEMSGWNSMLGALGGVGAAAIGG